MGRNDTIEHSQKAEHKFLQELIINEIRSQPVTQKKYCRSAQKEKYVMFKKSILLKQKETTLSVLFEPIPY